MTIHTVRACVRDAVVPFGEGLQEEVDALQEKSVARGDRNKCDLGAAAAATTTAVARVFALARAVGMNGGRVFSVKILKLFVKEICLFGCNERPCFFVLFVCVC